jgi:hypothetical protein
VQGKAWLKSASQNSSEGVLNLTLLYPEDILETEADGKLTVTYFHDRTKWSVLPEAMAKVEHHKLNGDSVYRDRVVKVKALSSELAFEVPNALFKSLSESDVSQTQASEGGLFQEEVHLSGYVDTGVYPPVFHWAPNTMSDYSLSLFDDSGKFLHAFDVEDEDFAYPAGQTAPFQMTKGKTYLWQVTDVDGNVLVQKYPFAPLTRIQIQEIRRYQHGLVGHDTSTQVDLLLVLAQVGALDKYLHLLSQMLEADPTNLQIQTALARAYLQRKAPSHALKTLGIKLE